MSAPSEDPRVTDGIVRMLADLRGRRAAGIRPIGWKVGFGAPAALEMMRTTAPLVGYLTEQTVVATGSTVSVAGWQRGIIECEVAVYMGADLPGGASPESAAAAVGAVGPAIELADIDLPLDADHVADIVAGDIFHRGVVFGDPDPARAGLDITGLTAHIMVDSSVHTVTSELQTMTGLYPGIVAGVANALAAHDELLREGDVIITGSVTAPIPVGEGSTFTFTLEPFPPISVTVN